MLHSPETFGSLCRFSRLLENPITQCLRLCRNRTGGRIRQVHAETLIQRLVDRLYQLTTGEKSIDDWAVTESDSLAARRSLNDVGIAVETQNRRFEAVLHLKSFKPPVPILHRVGLAVEIEQPMAQKIVRAAQGSALPEILRRADRFKVIPDMRWEHKYDYVCGHRAVSVWIVKGNAKDGRVLNYQGCDLWEFKDGLVHKKDTYWKIVQPDA